MGEPVHGAGSSAALGRQLRDGAELEAPQAQVVDHPSHRCDRLGPVAATVVQEDDGAVAAGRLGAGDDSLHAGASPVLAIAVGEGDEVAEPGSAQDGVGLGAREAVRGRRVRRSQECRSHAGRSGQGGLRQRELEVLAPFGQCAQLGVGEGVRPNVVSLCELPSDELGVGHHLGTHNEKRRQHLLLPQEVEELGSPRAVGTVVEGEGDRHRRRGRAVQVAAGVGDQRARRCRRRHARRNGRRPADLAAGVALDEQSDEQGCHEDADEDPVRARLPPGEPPPAFSHGLVVRGVRVLRGHLLAMIVGRPVAVSVRRRSLPLLGLPRRHVRRRPLRLPARARPRRRRRSASRRRRRGPGPLAGRLRGSARWRGRCPRRARSLVSRSGAGSRGGTCVRDRAGRRHGGGRRASRRGIGAGGARRTRRQAAPQRGSDSGNGAANLIGTRRARTGVHGLDAALPGLRACPWEQRERARRRAGQAQRQQRQVGGGPGGRRSRPVAKPAHPVTVGVDKHRKAAWARQAERSTVHRCSFDPLHQIPVFPRHRTGKHFVPILRDPGVNTDT